MASQDDVRGAQPARGFRLHRLRRAARDVVPVGQHRGRARVVEFSSPRWARRGAFAPPRRAWCRALARGHLLPGEERSSPRRDGRRGGGPAAPLPARRASARRRRTPTRLLFASRTARAFRMVCKKRFRPRGSRPPCAARSPPPRPRGSVRRGGAAGAGARGAAGIARVEAGGGVSMVSPAVVTSTRPSGSKRPVARARRPAGRFAFRRGTEVVGRRLHARRAATPRRAEVTGAPLGSGRRRELGQAQ